MLAALFWLENWLDGLEELLFIFLVSSASYIIADRLLKWRTPSQKYRTPQ